MKFALVASMFAAATLLAQTPAVDHLSQSELLAKMPQLERQAKASGSASITLARYPGYFTMLALRERSGGAELHQKLDDIFYIVRGHATLVTGGSISDATTASSGEIKGSAVEGGTRTALAPGDFAHIPAGISHQLLLPAKHDVLLYYVIKVQAK